LNNAQEAIARNQKAQDIYVVKIGPIHNKKQHISLSNHTNIDKKKI
jgi:hypothetical protein